MPHHESAKGYLSRDRLSVSWMALNRRANFTKSSVVTSRVEIDLNYRKSVCRLLPDEMEPNSRSVLVSIAHHGLRYQNSYVSRKVQHTYREAAHAWLQAVKTWNNSLFEVCAQRSLETDPNGTISSAQVDIVSFPRQGGYSGGLVKLSLREGRKCAWVSYMQTSESQGVERGQGFEERIFLSARLHSNDACLDGEICPTVLAWVERNAADGFAICAESVLLTPNLPDSSVTIDLSGEPSSSTVPSIDESASDVSSHRQERKIKNSVHIHWYVVPKMFDNDEHCQYVPSDE